MKLIKTKSLLSYSFLKIQKKIFTTENVLKTLLKDAEIFLTVKYFFFFFIIFYYFLASFPRLEIAEIFNVRILRAKFEEKVM